MRTLFRRRVIVLATVAVVVAVVAGTAWYVLSEGRRMGRAAEWVLTRRTGLSITVERAWYRPGRFLLRGARVAPGPTFPLDVWVRELEIAAGIMSLVAPAGRTVSIVATSISVTVAESASPTPGPGRIEAFRSRVLAFLEWPGGLTIRVHEGELRTSAGVFRFALSGEKTGPGLTLTVSPEGDGESRVGIRAAAALGRALDLVVDAVGLPRVLAAVWSGTGPPVSSFAARAQLQLLAGGVVSSFSRVTLGTNPEDRAVLDFTSRYDSASGELRVSRYSLTWRNVRVQGTARLAPEAPERPLSATAAGDAAGSALSGTRSYALGIAVDASIDEPAKAGPRLPATTALTGSASVRGTLVSARPATFRGTLQARLPRARFEAGGPVELFDVRVDAPVTVGVAGDPPPGSLAVARVLAYGLTFEKLTGRARLTDQRVFLSELRYIEPEEGGGEVGIDAIEGLLPSASVQTESTGILRRTLESLRLARLARTLR
jgi:hypothetical protein